MHRTAVSALPDVFVWTRFGTEAGEPIQRILERKEAERRANDGLFFWGIGNAIAPAVRELLAFTQDPEVLFSPIRSRPRTVDVEPDAVVEWRCAEDLTGRLVDIPDDIVVTSRWEPERPEVPHYALVCFSPKPLRSGDLGCVRMGQLRNLRSGLPVGPSQVTAVVRHDQCFDGSLGTEYPVALRARLASPYYVRLHAPLKLTTTRSSLAVPLQLRF